MARDEDAIIEAKKYYRNDIKCYDAFLHGVEWVEEQIANVWHDASVPPNSREAILIQFAVGGCDVYTLRIIDDDKWRAWCKEYCVSRWAYISDLLPKGGEKRKTNQSI